MTVRILHGDVRAMLATLPDASVQMCVTSPPYWGLRSYLPDGHPDKHLEIGSEPTVDEWVDTMVTVFRDVRRVLKDDGVLFLNLGDSYCSGAGADRLPTTLAGPRVPSGWSNRSQPNRVRSSAMLKPKDLIGQPWMVALALRDQGCADIKAVRIIERAREAIVDAFVDQAVPDRVLVALEALAAEYAEAKGDSWWLRQEIIWAKPGPMPESTRDRCTKAHEHVFLLTKRERYFWNFDAVQEPVTGGANARGPGNRSHGKYAESLALDGNTSEHRTKSGIAAHAERVRAARKPTPAGWAFGEGDHSAAAHQTREQHRKSAEPDPNVGRRYYKGNGVGFGHGYDADSKPRVTGVNPKAAAGADHGGYQEGKSARMAEAGIGDELVDTRNPRSVWTIPAEPFRGSHYATYPTELARRCITAGSREGDTALDPFMGSGTTGIVCDRMGRDCIGIDLDERNIPMAEHRLAADAGHVSRTRSLFTENDE